jgi:hypothetical protein
MRQPLTDVNRAFLFPQLRTHGWHKNLYRAIWVSVVPCGPRYSKKEGEHNLRLYEILTWGLFGVNINY